MVSRRSSDRMRDQGQAQLDTETLRRAVALVNLARDPALPGMLLGLVLVVAGFVVAIVSGIFAAGAPAVALQTPYLVSGGLGGVALVVIGALVAAIQAERRDGVDANAEMWQVSDGMAALVESAIARRHRG